MLSNRTPRIPTRVRAVVGCLVTWLYNVINLESLVIIRRIDAPGHERPKPIDGWEHHNIETLQVRSPSRISAQWEDRDFPGQFPMYPRKHPCKRI